MPKKVDFSPWVVVAFFAVFAICFVLPREQAQSQKYDKDEMTINGYMEIGTFDKSDRLMSHLKMDYNGHHPLIAFLTCTPTKYRLFRGKYGNLASQKFFY